MLSCLLPDPSIVAFGEVEIAPEGRSVVCQVSSIQAAAVCPGCGQMASKIHSHYRRKLSDLPWAGIPVQLWLSVRRFWCSHANCDHRIFCERIPTVAAPWARRTQRMATAQQAIGLSAGGSAGSRLCVALAMDAGIDLLLSLIRSGQQVEQPTPRVLGVDDWAMRKGQTYGTILVDLEQGTVVDLLPDRTAEGLEAWLKAHPGIEIISRDRAEAYALGASNGAPDAIQVADRWHLLKNLTDAIYKILQKHQAAIEKSLASDRSNDSNEGNPPTSLSVELADRRAHSASDLSRQTRVVEVQRLHTAGWTNKAIAAHLQVCPKTISRYLQMESPLLPLRRSGRRQLMDPFKPYIIERWNNGCHNASQLYREIQAQGYPGKKTVVRDYARQLRQASGLPPRVRTGSANEVQQDPSKRRPTLRKMAHLIGCPEDKLDESEKEFILRVSCVGAQIEKVVGLTQEFGTIIRQRKAEVLDDWLERAEDSLLNGFVAGLRQDHDAVRAALTLPWSNGPTEGHVNRLKCIKRQMYGRAKLDLLRQRVLAT